MNRTTTELSEMQKHRAMVAGEYLGEAILALSRWVSRAAQALNALSVPVREQAHKPR
ncbi:MAG TPA: hypothetical protein VF107_07135 [Burkholderiaceae bacterium]